MGSFNAPPMRTLWLLLILQKKIRRMQRTEPHHDPKPNPNPSRHALPPRGAHLPQDGIAIVGHHNASHGVQQHLQPKDELCC